MLEDFHSKNSEDPLEVFRSMSKSVIGILPYLAAVVLMFAGLALAADTQEPVSYTHLTLPTIYSV